MISSQHFGNICAMSRPNCSTPGGTPSGNRPLPINSGSPSPLLPGNGGMPSMPNPTMNQPPYLPSGGHSSRGSAEYINPPPPPQHQQQPPQHVMCNQNLSMTNGAPPNVMMPQMESHMQGMPSMPVGGSGGPGVSAPNQPMSSGVPPMMSPCCPHPGMPPHMYRIPPLAAPPDHRIYDMNKRLQYRPEENDILWWDSFVTEFFEEDATLTLHVCFEEGPKKFTIGRVLIPRYFRTIFESGCCELYYVLRCPRDTFQPTHFLVDSEAADMVMNMQRPIPTTVIAEGRLLVEFACDELMRIRSWHFLIRSHRELLFRSMLGVPDPAFFENLSRNITRLGLTVQMLNFLRLSVVLEPMQELMSRQKAYSLTPRDALKTTLFQKWQKMTGPTEASRPTNKRRKRKPTANSSANESSNRSSKRKPSPAPPLQNMSMPGDVMVVGEPTLMGGNFGDEDERMITRLENVKFGSSSSINIPIGGRGTSLAAPNSSSNAPTPAPNNVIGSRQGSMSSNSNIASQGASMPSFSNATASGASVGTPCPPTATPSDTNMPCNSLQESQLYQQHPARPTSVKSEQLCRPDPPGSAQLTDYENSNILEGNPRSVHTIAGGPYSVGGGPSDRASSTGVSESGNHPTQPPLSALTQMVSSNSGPIGGARMPPMPSNVGLGGFPMMMPQGMNVMMDGGGLPPGMHPVSRNHMMMGNPGLHPMGMPPGMRIPGGMMMDPRFGHGPLMHMVPPGGFHSEIPNRFSHPGMGMGPPRHNPMYGVMPMGGGMPPMPYGPGSIHEGGPNFHLEFMRPPGQNALNPSASGPYPPPPQPSETQPTSNDGSSQSMSYNTYCNNSISALPPVGSHLRSPSPNVTSQGNLTLVNPNQPFPNCGDQNLSCINEDGHPQESSCLVDNPPTQLYSQDSIPVEFSVHPLQSSSQSNVSDVNGCGSGFPENFLVVSQQPSTPLAVKGGNDSGL